MKVLALASKESKALNHSYVGTEHILLGLLREGDGVAAWVFKNLGVDVELTRQEILKELTPDFAAHDHRANQPEATDSLSGMRPSRKADSDLVDTSKHYDVYCVERNQELVICRNELFENIKKLFPASRLDPGSVFVELKQADGQTVFIWRHSIIKFCQSGAAPDSAGGATRQA